MKTHSVNVLNLPDGKIKLCDISKFSEEDIKIVNTFIIKSNLNFKIDKSMQCLIVHMNKIYLKSKKNYSLNNINIKPIINEKKQNIINQIINKIETNLLDNELISEEKPEYNIILTLLYKNFPYECNYNIKNKNIDFCSQISDEKYSKYLIGKAKPVKFKNLKIYGINLGTIDFKNNFDYLDVKNNNKHFLNNASTYLVNLDNITDLNSHRFIFKNTNSRLLLHGTFKKNFNFSFLNEIIKNPIDDLTKITNNEEMFNNHLLTGCVTFYKTIFNGGQIISSDMDCEDSINIMNSSWKINNIKVDKSKFDAIDVDFSDIIFDNIQVNNANNDCVDFSKGNYKIKNIKVYNCNDKGLSAGEKSNVVIDNFIANKYNIGLASKDQSSVKIKKAKITNRIKDKNNICLAAYQKKINYIGGKIIVDKLNCDSKIYVSNYSEDLYNNCKLKSLNNNKLFCDKNNFIDNYSSINVKTRN